MDLSLIGVKNLKCFVQFKTGRVFQECKNHKQLIYRPRPFQVGPKNVIKISLDCSFNLLNF
jgi:hypothetical protein